MIAYVYHLPVKLCYITIALLCDIAGFNFGVKQWETVSLYLVLYILLSLLLFLVAIDINDEVWTDSDDVGSSDDSDHNESPPGSQQEASLNPVEVSSNVLVRWMLAFFLLLQAQFHLADRVLSLIFYFLKVFFAVLGRLYAPCVVIGEKLPSSLYMAQKTYRKMQKACF